MTYQVIMEWDAESEAWVTYVPELGGISTFGKTEREAIAMTEDMIRGYVEAFGSERAPAAPHTPRVVEVRVA